MARIAMTDDEVEYLDDRPEAGDKGVWSVDHLVTGPIECTASDLIWFENEIAAKFNYGLIKAPVHLAGGNEKQLIDIFRGIRSDDWVLCSWRSHYHCLLKGVPRDKLRDAIIAGRSIALCFPEQKVLSSAIVGGICPIAVGIAWAIKRRKSHERVHVFVGDMTATTGIYHEASKYARGHDLPINWWIEDNGNSVCTETWRVWGNHPSMHFENNEQRYTYGMSRSHVGTGQWVKF